MHVCIERIESFQVFPLRSAAGSGHDRGQDLNWCGVTTQNLEISQLLKIISHLLDGGQKNYFTEMGSGSKEGSYPRLMDFCITRL